MIKTISAFACSQHRASAHEFGCRCLKDLAATHPRCLCLCRKSGSSSARVNILLWLFLTLFKIVEHKFDYSINSNFTIQRD
jgi:hypothetical protein